MLKTAELKNTCTRNYYNNEQSNGIVNFEKIMKRNGLGYNNNNNNTNIYYYYYYYFFYYQI